MRALYLVTGGAGFIGSHIVEALLSRGERVRVLDNLSTGRRENLAGLEAAEFIEGDLCDPDAVARAMEGVDYCLHQGALPSVTRSLADPVASHRNNATGTLVVLEAARRSGVKRFVLASSSSVYGACEVLPKVESARPEPMSPYAASKLAAEGYALAYTRSMGLPCVILRYFNVFGPRQDPASPYAAVVPRFAMALLRGEPVPLEGDGRQTRDFTYVSNVVEANLLACTAPAAVGKVYNIACGRQTSVLELAERMAAILGVRPGFRRLPPRPGDVRHSVASIEAARRELGYEPSVGVAEGLERTIRYLERVLAQA